MKNNLVFLGGTCNNSKWREELISMFRDEVTYFNPVVENWTPECQAEELKQRETCEFCLYVITPKMTGVYSIAEVVDDSNKRPEKTLFCVLNQDNVRIGMMDNTCCFIESKLNSLNAVKEMVHSNGGMVFNSLEEIATYINRWIEVYEQKNI